MHDLGRRNTLVALPFAIERAVPALRFDKSSAMTEALPWLECLRLFCGVAIGEKQGIGNVLASLCRHVLLNGFVLPAQQFEQRINKLVFGFCFGWLLVA